MLCIEWTGKAVGVNKRLETTRKGGMYPNPKYKAFKEELMWTIKKAWRKETITDPVTVHVDLTTAHDIDNLLKPCFDAMESVGVIENDKQIMRLFVTKHPKKRSEMDRIRITLMAVDFDC